MKRTVLPIVMATVWIAISEFVRNTFLVHTLWVEHYQNLGLVFPDEPFNGAIWGIWSLVFAIVIFIISKRFSLLETTAIAWTVGFVFMWLVIGNLGVLPIGILPLAVPLSVLETFVASLIIKRMARPCA